VIARKLSLATAQPRKTANKMKLEYETAITNTLEAIGLSLAITSGPTAKVRDDWPCIAYTVRLDYKGRAVIETDYSLGVGHAEIPKRLPVTISFTDHEHAIFHTLERNPHANLSDKAAHASFAAKLARHQKVVPQLADVVHSLLSDGEAYFDAATFEDWAANYGYDPDSRKAEEIFRKCDAIGRELSRGIPAETLSKLRAIVADL
jgi:hypothetical protein